MAPAICPSVGENIKQLVLAYRATGSLHYLTEILLSYVSNFDEACSKNNPTGSEQLQHRRESRIRSSA